MFEQRFDHICRDHAEAMAAMEERVRVVVARREARDGSSVSPAAQPVARNAARAAAPSVETPAGGAPARPGTQNADGRNPAPSESPASPVAERDPAVSSAAAALWPIRAPARPAGAPMLDPRWN